MPARPNAEQLTREFPPYWERLPVKFSRRSDEVGGVAHALLMYAACGFCHG